MITIKKEENQIPEIELLTPLHGEFYLEDSGWNMDEDFDPDQPEPLDGQDLAQYEEAIAEKVAEENRLGTEDGKVCNLMDYFSGSKSIQEKVESAVVSVKNIDGTLYGCTTLKMKELLESHELTELCEYITGQYSDGWGEGFEQREIAVDGGTLYVHFWQPGQKEMEKREVPKTENEIQHPIEEKTVRPKLKLLGHDGNIFSILGDANRLLQRCGRSAQAKEMIERVENSGGYYKALGIISEYVETELSEPKENQKPDKNTTRPERGECR